MAGIYDDKIVGLKEQRDFARNLRMQPNNPPMGQMVGGHYVSNIGGAIAGAIGNIMGGYQEGQANEKLDTAQRQKIADTIRYMNQAGVEAPSGLAQQAETPAQSPSMMDRAGALFSGNAQPQGVPAQAYQQNVAQNVDPAAYEKALTGLISVNPEQAAPMAAMYQARSNREATAAERAYTHERNTAQDAEKLREYNQTDKRLTQQAQESNALRRDIAALAQSNRQAPQGSVVEVVDPNDPTRMIKKNTLSGEVYGYSAQIPKVAAIAPEVSDANAAKRSLNFLDTKYLSYDDKGNETKDHVADLIKESTSGGLQKFGAGTKTFLTGESTSGAKAIARLATIGNEITLNTLNGKLGSGISNADRDFLQAKLGDISNPDKSAGEREAAWSEYKAGVRALAGGGQLNLTNLKAPDKVGDIHSEADAILRGK